ncbi:MAG: AEC family transporter [Clostridia bacterium]|nr:AEC family transporter [Clostridia bacterium]
MYETFLYALRAVLPILLMIAVGFFVRRVGPWDGSFYKSLNKLGFHVFMPLNLFCNIYEIESLAEVNWPLVLVVLSGIVLCLLLGILVARFLPPNQRGVLVQATFRSNQAILGLPVAQALGGASAMAFASVVSGLTVPFFNVLAVLVLVFYSGNREKKPSVGSMVKKILTNPLIIGSAIGILVVALRQFGLVPAWLLRDQMPSVYKVAKDLAKMASPIMLFVLGASLDFKATGKLLPQITLGAVMRLVVSPVLIIGLCLLLRKPLGVTAVEMPSLVAVFASPVAVSSAVMVQEIGGDDQLASQLVVWTSAVSMATIFAIVFALRTIGAL